MSRITDADVSGAIDDELNEAMDSSSEVAIEPGAYSWNGGGFAGDFDDVLVYGDGGMVRLESTGDRNLTTRATSGTVRVENITFPGRAGSGKSRWRLQADEGANIELGNVHMPAGSGGFGRHPSPIGVYTPKGHDGRLLLERCSIEGFANNGVYAGPGKKEAPQGTTHVDHCFFVGNDIDNVRIGGGDTVRSTVIIQDRRDHDAFRTGRGVRVRYGGSGPALLENVHIININCSSPIVPRDDGLVLKDVYIRNETGGSVFKYPENIVSAENVHVSGSGNTDDHGYATGSEAPRMKPPWEWDDDDVAPSPAEYDHRLFIYGSGDKARYSFSTSGPLRQIAEGPASINPDDLVTERDAIGFVFGGVDAYEFGGEVTEFVIDGEVDRLELDGAEVTVAALDAVGATQPPADGTDELRSRVGALEGQVTAIDQRTTDTDSRLSTVEQTLDTIRTTLNDMF